MSRLSASTVVLAGLVTVLVSWPTRIAPSGPTVAVLAFGLVAGLLGLASAVGVVFCWWHLRLESRAWQPGPVTVLPFKDNTSQIGGTSSAARTTDLKARFEYHLVRCRFTQVTPTPSAESATDFLTVVDAASDDVRGPWGAALRFTRLLAPVSAYQVACTMQPGVPDFPSVLVVELRRVAGPSVAPVVVTAKTTDRAVEQAAHEVAARILPRTKLCRQAPWTGWRDRRLPAELYDSYQRFQLLQADRYFDEAMAALRNAVRLDPGNLSLRLDLGKLQERMQLYLDALLTYDDIITVAAQTDIKLWRWWSPRAPRPLPQSRLIPASAQVLSRYDVVILIARYRHALLLGLSDTLAGQWWGRPERCVVGEHQTSREWRRAHLRTALTTRLMSRYGHLLQPPAEKVPPYFLGRLREVTTDAQRDGRIAAARLFFASMSRYEFDQLVHDWTRPLRWPRRRHEVLPIDALMMGLPWSALRYRMAASWAKRTGNPFLPEAATSGAVPRRREVAIADDARELATGDWPPKEWEIDRIINRIAADATEPRSWRSHFNAACVLSLPLLLDGPPSWTGGEDPPGELDERQKSSVTGRAVRELEKAVRSPNADQVLRQRDWLLSEDPDLDHLRERREFKDFEATTFGSIGRAVERGPDIHRWEQSTYVARFISAAAGEMGVLWRDRQQRQWEDEPDWRSWLEEEMAGWGLAERLALDSRDSHTREEVTRRIADTGRLVAFQSPHVRHPQFTDIVLDRQLASMEGKGEVELLAVRYHGPREPGRDVKDRVATAIRSSDQRLDDLARSLRERYDVSPCGCTLGRRAIFAGEELALRSEIIERWYTDRSSPAVLGRARTWCDVSARRWETLASWFDDESFGQGTLTARRKSFRTAIEQRWWTWA